MKEILKKIVNFLKQSDKLKRCLVNLLVMLIAGSINIWLGIGLAAGLSVGKELKLQIISGIGMTFSQMQLE